MIKPGQALLAGLAAAGLALLSGCATSPEAQKTQAYDRYWQCTSQAVRPYVTAPGLPARQAAMRAQAACSAPWQTFRQAQIRVVQSKVARDSADLGEALGGQQALVWRQRVTRALTDYVVSARRQ